MSDEGLTEEQWDLVFQLREQYWLEFSKLVNETLAKAPEHLRDHLAVMLQESSSVYGRKT